MLYRNLSCLPALALLACDSDAGFKYPLILGGWDLATSTTTSCPNAADETTRTFSPCESTPCKGMEFNETQVGYGTVSENGSVFGSVFGTVVDYTIDDTTVSFLEMTFRYAVTETTLTLTDVEPDDKGCTVVEVFNARP